MGSFRTFLVSISALVSFATLAWFPAAAFGTKYGLWNWRFGFGRMTLEWGPKLAIAAMVAAAFALVVALIVRPGRLRILALCALAIPAGLLAGMIQFRARAAEIPPIHDISTDVINPPGFSAQVAGARATLRGANSLDLPSKTVPPLGRFGAYEGRRVVDIQRQAYPDIKTMRVRLPPDLAFDVAFQAVQENRWSFTAMNKERGWLEARVKSFWFGFVDDISIRVTPTSDPNVSLVDIRSVSRVGVSDLGANARRVRDFMRSVAVGEGRERVYWERVLADKAKAAGLDRENDQPALKKASEPDSLRVKAPPPE